MLALVESVNPSTDHRLLSHRRWPAKKLAKLIVHYAISRFVPDGCIKVVGGENVDGHRGKMVCDSPGLADTGGQNARNTSKATDGSVGILPERTKN